MIVFVYMSYAESYHANSHVYIYICCGFRSKVIQDKIEWQCHIESSSLIVYHFIFELCNCLNKTNRTVFDWLK